MRSKISLTLTCIALSLLIFGCGGGSKSSSKDVAAPALTQSPTNDNIPPGETNPLFLESFSPFSQFAITLGNSGLITAGGSSHFGASSLAITSDGLVSNSFASATRNRVYDLSTAPGFWVVSNLLYRQSSNSNNSAAAVGGVTLFFGHALNLNSDTGNQGGLGRISFRITPNSSGAGMQSRWIPTSSYSVVNGTPNLSNPFKSLRVRFDQQEPGQQYSAEILGLSFERANPAIVLSFDDGWKDAYYAHIEAKKRGIRMTHYLTGSAVNSLGHVSTADLLEMSKNGECLAVHGAHSNERMSGNWQADLLTSTFENSNLYADYMKLKDIAVENPSLNFTFEHAAYPEGAYGVGTDFKIMFDRLNKLGIKTARTTGLAMTPIHPKYENPYAMKAMSLNNTLSLNDAKRLVDDTIASGGTLMLYGHRLSRPSSSAYQTMTGTSLATPTDLLTWKLEDFQLLLDYIALKENSAGLKVQTVKEWYDSLH